MSTKSDHQLSHQIASNIHLDLSKAELTYTAAARVVKAYRKGFPGRDLSFQSLPPRPNFSTLSFLSASWLNHVSLPKYALAWCSSGKCRASYLETAAPNKATS